MRTLKIESLDEGMQRKMLKARQEPVVVTERGSPVLVVRNLLDDDMADDLIAQNPEFRKTIRLARKQKALGRVKSLAEVRRKYAPTAS
jgi:PHD/YefM family antitoxin component YafN of YafNO toxin-antitoxin module